MRCSVCNADLSDYEATLRHGVSRQFLEMCQPCINSMDFKLPVIGRADLMSEADTELSENLFDDDELTLDEGGDYDEYWDER
jgi:hypothetical protein